MHWLWLRRLSVPSGALAVCATSCSSAPAATAAASDGSAEFLAFASSFSNFCSWSSAPAVTADDASDGLHGLGPLTVYWNQPPPHGSTRFPVGTIIVKSSQEADPATRTVFAMVKRGAPYNAPSGAAGWEWFSLRQNADCSVETILWRGPAPPAGETYAGRSVGDCNGCHGLAGNDAVWDSALQLTNF